MPASVAGAGISAAGTVAGAAISSKSAKKVAKIQAKTAADQMAQTKQYYNDAVARYQPEITNGNSAEALYNGAIGNGDSTAANAALKAFQNSTGYQTTLANGLAATNANAYALGLGRSGEALKALQDRATGIAQQSYGSWLGNVNTAAQTGVNAKNALSGAATTALQTNAQTSTNAANATSNAALANGSATSSALQQLGQLGGYAYQSSYGSPNYGALVAAQGSSPIAVYNNPDYSAG